MRVILTTLIVAAGAGCAPAGLAAANDGGVAGADAADASGQPTLLAAKQYAQALALDATRVYWTTQLGEVRSASLTGGDITSLVTGETRPWAIAVDATSVYWIEEQGLTAGAVRKAALAGGDPITLATGNIWPASIAVDESAVYWLTNDGLVMKASLDGQGQTALAAGEANPQALTVDAANVYWLTLGAVLKVPKTGGTPTQLAGGQAGAQSIAVDAQNVYWVNNTGGSVMKVSLDGQGLTAIASGLPLGQNGPYQIAVDDSGVYWTNGSGVVERASGPNLARTIIASGQPYPDGIALDAGNIYFINAGSGATADGGILELPKP